MIPVQNHHRVFTYQPLPNLTSNLPCSRSGATCQWRTNTFQRLQERRTGSSMRLINATNTSEALKRLILSLTEHLGGLQCRGTQSHRALNEIFPGRLIGRPSPSHVASLRLFCSSGYEEPSAVSPAGSFRVISQVTQLWEILSELFSRIDEPRPDQPNLFNFIARQPPLGDIDLASPAAGWSKTMQVFK